MARRTLGIVKIANSSNGKKGTAKKIDETPLGGGMACQQKTCEQEEILVAARNCR